MQRHRHLFERSIAGTLAQSDHRHRGVRGAGLDRGERVGGREPEIVMGMDFDLEVGGLAQRRDQRVGRKRIEHAQRIGDAEAAGARRLGGAR